MKRNLKFTVSIMTLVAVLFIELGCSAVSVSASSTSVKACLDSYNSGVASILDPTNCVTEEKIKLIESETEKIAYELIMSKASNSLNVRVEPNAESEVAGKLYRDCGAEVLERQEGWTKIKSGQLVGWAKDEYLYFGEDAVQEALRVGYSIAVVECDALRVRSGASTNEEVLGYAAKGEKLAVVEDVNEEWLCVEYGDNVGYILREHVSEEFSIDYGESMEEINERKEKEAADKKKLVKNYGSMSASDYELYLLSALIYCEAGGESYEGKLAVGAVVCNRVRSTSYADTIPGVIYASGQFTPAVTGKLDRIMERGNIPQSCVDAAIEALGGYTNVGDCLYFRRNNGTRQGTVIGNHVFY